uniref:NADH dehydrogenase subunit 2 n=1 Tax=Desmaulus extinctorium TaxID=211681 RepID=UPI002551D1D9|nr:NADH dehydrogenase subunit 2 [Desmaulus extinctorium]WGH72841.1 NADH dehydrogenase subunit 2 [Desmaulus extinctorium]
MFSKLPYLYLFLITMFFGTLLSISSVYWLGIWVGLEVNLIGFLPLMVYSKGIMESESGVKYFVVQAIGSSLMLFGSLLSYSISFSWDLSSNLLGSSLEDLNYGYFYMMFIISGLCLKMGVFPFHFWLPSVMGGLSWFSCMLLATWQKIAPLFLFVFLIQSSSFYGLLLIVCVMCSGSTLVGGFGGFNQTQVRGLLAYSSISHLGWILFACIYSEMVMMIYLVIYLFITIILFFSLLYSDLNEMKSPKKMLDSWFSIKVVSMIMLLTLGGLPPFLGFFSKWLVMYASLLAGSYSVFLVFLISGSLISLCYYLSLFFNLYLSELKKFQVSKLFFSNSIVSVLLIILNFISLVFIFNINFFDILF